LAEYGSTIRTGGDDYAYNTKQDRLDITVHTQAELKEDDWDTVAGLEEDDSEAGLGLDVSSPISAFSNRTNRN
jgi:hypothetical protein